MKIEREFVGDVAILTIQGKLTIDNSVDELWEHVEEILHSFKNTCRIILDLAEVPYMDGAGLGQLIFTFTLARKRGANLILCNLQPKIKNLLAITKLLTAFNIYSTREEALKSV